MPAVQNLIYLSIKRLSDCCFALKRLVLRDYPDALCAGRGIIWLSEIDPRANRVRNPGFRVRVTWSRARVLACRFLTFCAMCRGDVALDRFLRGIAHYKPSTAYQVFDSRFRRLSTHAVAKVVSAVGHVYC